MLVNCYLFVRRDVTHDPIDIGMTPVEDGMFFTTSSSSSDYSPAAVPKHRAKHSSEPKWASLLSFVVEEPEMGVSSLSCSFIHSSEAHLSAKTIETPRRGAPEYRKNRDEK